MLVSGTQLLLFVVVAREGELGRGLGEEGERTEEEKEEVEVEEIVVLEAVEVGKGQP